MQFSRQLFTTKYGYVRKLIPPVAFPDRLAVVFDRLEQKKIEENPLYLEISPNFTAGAEFGKGRYIASTYDASRGFRLCMLFVCHSFYNIFILLLLSLLPNMYGSSLGRR
jgi:hypothetical protein